MGEAWKTLQNKIVHLEGDLRLFEVNFLDRDSFKQFCEQDLPHDLYGYENIYITGYFSETIREKLEKIAKMRKKQGRGVLRLICPEFPTQSKRDRRNLQALQKMAKAGAQIRVNDRLHARFFVASKSNIGGLLIIGSFDFNTECIGKERYDAGIKTQHPDLVKSAIDLFEQVWSETESIPLEDFVKKGRS